MNQIVVYMVYFMVYTLALLIWGKSGFKKTNNIKDFCVAGNTLGPFISMATFSATLFSAVSMQSVSGSVYLYGYSTILYSVVGWLLGNACLIFAAFRIRQAGVMTIPEYFWIRYQSKGYQMACGIGLMLCYILYIIIQIKGFGIVVSEMLDIHYNIAAALIYLFIVYTGFGGLFSIAKTDVLNFLILCIGILVVAGFILGSLGGMTNIHIAAEEISDGALLNPTTNGRFSPMMITTTGLAWGAGTAANPQYIVRIVSARDDRTALRMIWISTLVLGLLYLGLIIIGLGFRVMAPEAADTYAVDEILAFAVKTKMSPWLSGIMFIAVIAAAVSTANSQLLLVAGSFSYDVYRNLSAKEVTNERFLTLNRIVIFISATVALLLSMQPVDRLLIYGSYIWSFIAVAFLWPVYGGLYWKGATKRGAMAASAGGALMVGGWYLLVRLGLIDTDIHPVLPSLAVSFALFIWMSRREK